MNFRPRSCVFRATRRTPKGLTRDTIQLNLSGPHLCLTHLRERQLHTNPLLVDPCLVNRQSDPHKVFIFNLAVIRTQQRGREGVIQINCNPKKELLESPFCPLPLTVCSQMMKKLEPSLRCRREIVLSVFTWCGRPHLCTPLVAHPRVKNLYQACDESLEAS